ncbi:MAG: twitching motility protein PilT [Vulcanisaeta sp. AZ3]|jgi:UPF0271 protein|nr:MAG: twitching motility protein PilT [Vulcanisaeta sp. AZ3]
MSEPIIILDTSAMLHARDARSLISLGHLITTNYVIEELKDVRAMVMPELLNLEVYEMDRDEINEVRRNYHIPRLLSDADVSLIALAIRLRDKNPVVVTDDTLLIKFLRRLGIKYLVIFLRRKH